LETGGHNLRFDPFMDAAREENPWVTAEQTAVAVLGVGRGLPGPLMAIRVFPRQRTKHTVEVFPEVVA
jgi:hypothetical protein